jgi:hypothetical protein
MVLQVLAFISWLQGSKRATSEVLAPTSAIERTRVRLIALRSSPRGEIERTPRRPASPALP